MLVNVKSHKRKGRTVKAHKRRRKVLSHGRTKSLNKQASKEVAKYLGKYDPHFKKLYDDLRKGLLDSSQFDHNKLNEELVRFGRDKLKSTGMSKKDKLKLNEMVKRLRIAQRLGTI